MQNLLFLSSIKVSQTWLCCGLFVFSFLSLFNFTLCNSNISENITQVHLNDSLENTCTLNDPKPITAWSELLEDYVLSQSTNNRRSKDMIFMGNKHTDMPSSPGYMHTPINYHSSAYKRPEIYITKRIGEANELEPPIRPPIKQVNPQFRPMTNQMLQQQQQNQRQQPGFLQQLFGFGPTPTAPPPPIPTQTIPPPHRPPSQNYGTTTVGTQNFRAVTENDLYLLGAIEKLVYRVDYLESRIRRSEQLIYYLMAGNNQKEVRDPCPTNFTRINENCYYINSEIQVNWKTANTACKGLNAQLTEFEKVSENEEIMAYLLNQKQHRGRDYWLGGLNPGLLWIWSNSAKPVNPNMNLTSFAMQHGANETSIPVSHESNLIEDDENDKKKDTVLNNTVDIKGQGRCLRFSYDTIKHTYAYYGQECTSRHYYICEYEDKTLDNKIKKISRDLKLFI